MRLKNRIALVTGGARGIGLAIARALTAEGAVPVVADIDGDGARAAVETLDHRNGLALALNVADAESVAASIHAVTERYGRLDILVNNAGIGSSTPFLDLRLEDWNRTIAVNLTGAFLVAQAAARVMAGHGGGRIVNITSPSGQRGGRGRAAYGTSKAGLELLTKVMAVELAEHGITVNAIAPGPIETEMVRHAHDAETRAAYSRLIPMGRYGHPEDIGAAAVFLCSDESRYVHGHVLNVDGGFGGAGLMTGK